MVASSPSSRSLAVLPPSSGLPRAVESFVGGLLELVIYSIEGARDRIARLAVR